MKILLATENADKLTSFKFLLSRMSYGLEVVSMEEYLKDFQLPEEGVESLGANARVKAVSVKRALEAEYGTIPSDIDWIIGDDTGIFFDALNGAPGVQTKRYKGSENGLASMKLIVKELKEADSNTFGVYRCVLAAYDVKRDCLHMINGQLHGHLAARHDWWSIEDWHPGNEYRIGFTLWDYFFGSEHECNYSGVSDTPHEHPRYNALEILLSRINHMDSE